MKKTLCIMVLAIAGIAMPSMAQQTLKVPFFKELVKVKEGTALRKAPNASREKLILVEEDFMNVFGWAKTGDNAPVTYAALNGESGDWYDVYVSDESWGAENAYVLKNAATKVQTKALTLPAQDYLNIAQVKSGKYKDWYIQFIGNDMDGLYQLAFGVPIEGKVLMLKHVRISNMEGSENKFVQEDMDFYKEEFGNMALSLSKEFGGEFDFSINKLSANTKVVEMLIDKFYSFKDYTAIFFGVVGDNDWHCIQINKDKFKGKLYEIK